jgi:type IV secretory pathway TraG/TraD family ATPase VirD4
MAWRGICFLHDTPAVLNAQTAGYLKASVMIGLIAWILFVLDAYKPDPETWDRKGRFRDPKPPKELLRRYPAGIVLGKYRGLWVSTTKRIAHCLILGQSGCGKSVLLLNTLLLNTMAMLGRTYKGHELPKPRTIFCLDLKGELSQKATIYGNPKLQEYSPCILSINRRQLTGYDVLYKLHREQKPSTQEIISTINQIVAYLVPKPADVREPFFIDGARNLASGLMIGYFKEISAKGDKVEFIDLVDRILGSKIEDQISHFIDTTLPSSPEYKYLVMFSGMLEGKSNATLASVYSQLCNNLTIFSNDQDVRWFLKQNPKRATPDTMYRDHRSVYLTLNESKLEQYSQITRIILAQFLDAAFELPDASAADLDQQGYMFLLDEISRVINGSRDMARLLTNAVKTIRSKDVILVVINQTISAFQDSFGSKAVADDFVSNFEDTVVMSAKDTETAKWVSNLAGKFLQRSISLQYGNSKSNTTSYALQPLVSPDELLKLQAEQKEILICPDGVYRLDHANYFEDEELESTSKEFVKANKDYDRLF